LAFLSYWAGAGFDQGLRLNVELATLPTDPMFPGMSIGERLYLRRSAGSTFL